VHRHSQAARRDVETSAPDHHTHPSVPDLRDAAGVDLASMRLVLRQHLEDLRRRGVDEHVLRPIEAELRRYDETVEALITQQQG